MAKAVEKNCFEAFAVYSEDNRTKVFEKDEYEIKLKCEIPGFLEKPSAVGDKIVVECSIPEKYLKFDMEVYPGGLNSDNSGFVSFYLINKGTRDLNYTSLKYSLMKDNVEVICKKHDTPLSDKVGAAGWGKPLFIKRSEIEADPEKYLENGALVLTIHHCVEENIEVSPKVANKEVEQFMALGKGIKDLFLEHGLNGLGNTDVSLICSDGNVKCHKIILASISKVFRGYFKEENDTEENKNNTVTIKDASLESVQEMARFIYIGEFKEDYEIAGQLLYLAQKYDIESLKIKIENFLCTKISVKTVAELAGMGKTYLADKLEKTSLDFMMRNGKEVVESEGWSDLMKSHPEIVSEMIVKMRPPNN